MNNLLPNQRINSLKARAKEVTAWQPRHRYELTSFAVVTFQGDWQMNAVKHLTCDFDGEAPRQLLRYTQAGLNCIGIVVVLCCVCDSTARLLRGRNNA